MKAEYAGSQYAGVCLERRRVLLASLPRSSTDQKRIAGLKNQQERLRIQVRSGSLVFLGGGDLNSVRGKLIEEPLSKQSFLFVLKLTNNSTRTFAVLARIQKFCLPHRFSYRPHYLVFPTSQCGFGAGRRRGVPATESRRTGFLDNYSWRGPHLQDQY